MNRRYFFRQSSFAAASAYLSTLPLGFDKEDVMRLCILHTNDVHSRIDPFPQDGSRNAGQGGVAKRKSLIDQIRSERDNVLLLDAGDIFQGTPYFNLFGGELEFKLMSKLGYDIATVGNHDFDGGIQNLADQMKHASFDLINTNYNWDNTPMKPLIKPYKLKRYGPITIGVYGLGIELDGLVAKSMYGETQYIDPIVKANYIERMLKYDEKCDYIICLSHLGYRYRENKVSDVVLAGQTRYTDLIIGGHTHTFMQEPAIEKNILGEPVIINQVGFAGILLGQIDVVFEKGKKRKNLSSANQVIE